MSPHYDLNYAGLRSAPRPLPASTALVVLVMTGVIAFTVVGLVVFYYFCIRRRTRYGVGGAGRDVELAGFWRGREEGDMRAFLAEEEEERLRGGSVRREREEEEVEVEVEER